MPVDNQENKYENPQFYGKTVAISDFNQAEDNGFLSNIDYMSLLRAVLRGWYIVLVAALIFACVFYVYTKATVAPTYQADVLLYVNNPNISIGSASVNVSSDLSTSSRLVSTYLIILKSRATLNAIIEEAGLSCSTSDLSNKISAASVNGTEVFRVVVTTNSPYEAEQIANTIAEVLPKKITDVMMNCNVSVVDYAIVPSGRTGPSYSSAALKGLAVGAVLAAAVLALLDLLVTGIRTESELKSLFPDIPVIGEIPDMDLLGSSQGSRYSSYSYGYGQNNGGEKK